MCGQLSVVDQQQAVYQSILRNYADAVHGVSSTGQCMLRDYCVCCKESASTVRGPLYFMQAVGILDPCSLLPLLCAKLLTHY